MSRGGAYFTENEIKAVLDYYDIGDIKKISTINAGNKRSPKKIICTDKGSFFLKQRAKGKDDIYHAAFAHSVQDHLYKKNFPVAGLIPTRDGDTVLNLGNQTYELFNFVSGSRYEGSRQASIDAGKQLAIFHKYLVDFHGDFKPLRRTFHDSESVRGHLRIIAAKKNADRKSTMRTRTVRQLMVHYDNASTTVNNLGFNDWTEQIIHGDWHPGNMLFVDKKIVAVLDFDSVKLAPITTDIANGLLQFSILAGSPDPAKWPDYLDQEKLSNFMSGYRQITNLNDKMLTSLPDQMIETMIAETVLPIAATGFFGHISGGDFLEMILRKCNWINKNKNSVLKLLTE